jgi:hypothetical protein
MTYPLNKYKDQIIQSVLENAEQEKLLKPITAPQQAVSPLPTQDIGLTPFDVPQAPKTPIQPITPIQAPVQPSIQPRTDFTGGFQDFAQPEQKPFTAVQPRTDFTPETGEPTELQEISGDEASYLLANGLNTVGQWVNKIPTILGTIGVGSSPEKRTEAEVLANLEKLGINQEDLPEGYVKSLTETTNQPTTRAFWDDVMNYEIVKNYSEDIEKQYEGKITDRTRLMRDITSGALDLLPQTVLAYYTGGTSAMAYLFADSASNAQKTALNQGASLDEARTYGILSGAIEIGTEMIAGGWGGAPKGLFKSLAGKGVLGVVEDATMKMAKSDLGKKAVEMAYKYLGEGAEEYLAEVLGNYARGVYDPNQVKSWDEVKSDAFYAGLVGTLTSVVADLGRVGGVKIAEKVVQDNLSQIENLSKPEQLEATKQLLAKGGVKNIIVADTYEGKDITNTSGLYDPKTDTVVIPTETYENDNILTTSMVHEFTHTLENTGNYDNIKTNVLDYLEKTGRLDALRHDTKLLYPDGDVDGEIVADFLQDNLFKRITRKDGQLVSYTDALSFNAFIKNMPIKERSVLKRVFGSFLEQHYRGELTTEYNDLMNEFTQAQKKGDIVKMAQLEPRLNETLVKLNRTENASFFKGLELAVQTSFDTAGKKDFALKEKRKSAPKADVQTEQVLAEGKTETEIREILANEGKSAQEIDAEIAQLKQDIAIEQDLTQPTETAETQPTERQPVKGDGAVRERSFAKTVATSGSVRKAFVNQIERDIESGKFNYEAVTDKRSKEYAEGQIGEKPDVAFEQFKALFDSGKFISKDDAALAVELIKTYQKKGENYSPQKAAELVAMTATLGTEYGQFIQALHLIKRTGAEGRLYYWEKAIERLNKQYGKYKLNLELSNELRREMLDQTDEAGMKAVDAKIAKAIAEKLPSSTMDKLQAWQYMAMLSNPATDVRNMVSNAAMFGTGYLKDIVGTLGEQFIPKAQRTKSAKPLFADPELRTFVKKIAEQEKDIILANGAYDMKRDVESKKKVFNNTILDFLREKRFGLLEAEDALFKTLNFQRVLGEQMNAKGLRPDTITEKQLDALILESVKEAQVRTFTQANAFANKLNQLSKSSGTVGKALIQSVVPFKKTPANIMLTGVEYSPVGLMFNASVGLKRLSDGEITPAQFIDKVSSGLTGTGMFMMGAWLYNLGILGGGDEDDSDKKDQFDANLGEQKYAINFGGKSYTIDWLTPVSIPVLMGVEFEKMLNKEQDQSLFDTAIDSASQVLDPVFELTMLRGINDALTSYEDSGSARVGNMLSTMASNYALQFFPSIGGALARTLDPTVRTTNLPQGDLLAETVAKIYQKIPGLTYLNQPVVNVKGQEVKQDGDVWLRAVQNFISPTRVKADITDETDKEILRLYDRLGENSVIPSFAPNQFTYEGNEVELNAEEKTAYQKTLGTISYNLLTEVFNSPVYKSASDEVKGDMAKDVYDYAALIAKTELLNGRDEDFVSSTIGKIRDAENNGISVSEYLLMKADFDTMQSSGDFSKKEMILAKLVNLGYTDTQIYDYLVYVGDYAFTSADKRYIDILRQR